MRFVFAEAALRWRRVVGATATLPVLLAACAADKNAGPAHNLAYISERRGNPDILVARFPARRTQTLMATPRSDYPAAASSRGQLAVVTARDSAGRHFEQVFIVTPGQQPKALLEEREGFVRNPTFSADGKYLFIEADIAGFRDIFRFELDTRKSVQLTNAPEGSFEPAASPTDNVIAFVSSAEGNPEIYTMNADGAQLRRLTAFHREDGSPRWSADGRLLAFISNREGVDRVFVMNADGTGQRRIGAEHNGTEAESDISWAPTSRTLVFSRRLGGRWRLVLYDVEKKTERYLTPQEESARFAAFSPDGMWIAYTSFSADDPNVAVIRADGSGRIEVAATAAPEWLPVWLR